MISKFYAIPMATFIERGKPILKFLWDLKRLQLVKTMLSKKDKVGEISYGATVMQAAQLVPGRDRQQTKATEETGQQVN